MRKKKESGCLMTLIKVIIFVFVLMAAWYFISEKLLKKEERQTPTQAESTEEQTETTVWETWQESGEETENWWEEEQTETEETEDDGIAEAELDGKFYYEKLSSEEQAAYRKVAEGIREGQEQIRIELTENDQIERVLLYICNDFPEFFWFNGAGELTTYSGGEAYAEVTPQYSCTGEEREQMQAEIESAAQECLWGIDAYASDYEKILFVYEYLVNTVDYDGAAENSQNIYSSLVGRRSVCAGYARATQYLLERLGVFCTYVEGTTGEEQEAHAWNLVLCDGDYYYVDTTWGDPIFQESEGEAPVDNICYDYLCCNEEQLFQTHTLKGYVELPPCTKMDANYYVVNGMYYDTYDRETILAEMNAVIAAGGSQSVFKFANHELYQQAYADIFDDLIERASENLREQYHLERSEYRYQYDDTLNKITIWWKYE